MHTITKTLPASWEQLRADMDACFQTRTQSVLEHGYSVADYCSDLLDHLCVGEPLGFDWRLPDWLKEPDSRKLILDRLLPDHMMVTYQIYHDCGKPYCRTVDEDGRQHFPGHAALSAQVWRGLGGDEQVARLIERDMDIHLLKAEGLEDFAAQPEAASLLLTGLAEVHSNAAMFGGIESASFKAKWKQIDRRGRALVKIFAEQSISHGNNPGAATAA